jgi:hypothetical protein
MLTSSYQQHCSNSTQQLYCFASCQMNLHDQYRISVLYVIENVKFLILILHDLELNFRRNTKQNFWRIQNWTSGFLKLTYTLLNFFFKLISYCCLISGLPFYGKLNLFIQERGTFSERQKSELLDIALYRQKEASPSIFLLDFYIDKRKHHLIFPLWNTRRRNQLPFSLYATPGSS